MSRRMTSVVITVLGLAVLAGNACGQQKSLTEQLLGAWDLVSIDSIRADGSRLTALATIRTASHSLTTRATTSLP